MNCLIDYIVIPVFTESDNKIVKVGYTNKTVKTDLNVEMISDFGFNWFEANMECQRRGQQMVTFSTRDSMKYYLRLLSLLDAQDDSIGKVNNILFISLEVIIIICFRC